MNYRLSHKSCFKKEEVIVKEIKRDGTQIMIGKGADFHRSVIEK